MTTIRSAMGVLMCAIVFGACSEEASDGSGSNLNEADGAAATGGSAGSSSGSSGASGSVGASGTNGSGGSSGGTAGSSGSSDAGDGGAVCKWDGTSARPVRDCIGDQYEYFGPGCRMTWSHCDDQNTEQWVLDCRKEGANIVCDCLDNGRFVNTISAPTTICPTRPPGPIESPGPDIHLSFFELAKSCLFCIEPS